MRIAFRWGAIAIVAVAGCAKSALGPWTPAVDPPTPGVVDLSVFELAHDGASCRWMRVDPIGGGRQSLLWMPADCSTAHVVWSPDGRRATVASEAGDSGDVQSLHEVSLVDGSTRAITSPPGTVTSLFYRDGRLYAVVEPVVEPSLLDRLLHRTPPEPEQATETFELDDHWKKVDVEPPDSAIAARWDSQTMGRSPLPDLPPAPKKVALELADQYGGDDWVTLGPDLYLSKGGEGQSVVHRGANGEYETIGDLAYEDGEGGALAIRDRWALLSYEGSSPELIDLKDGGKVIYRAPDGSTGTFWPR